LRLKEPVGDPLLRYLYQAQQGNLRLIADELKAIGEASDVCGRVLFYLF
jgi:hypothetical protein